MDTVIKQLNKRKLRILNYNIHIYYVHYVYMFIFFLFIKITYSVLHLNL